MDSFKIIDVKLSWITVDGMDVTDKLIELLQEVSEIDILFSGGITFAGFNVLDPFKVFEETGIPLVIVSKKKPDNKAVLKALREHFKDWKKRWEIIERVGEVMEVVNLKSETVYVELVGINEEEAISAINAWTLWGKRPEPLRVINLVVKGLSNTLLI